MKNLTWKQFKEAVESKGVADDTEIGFIDVGSYPPGTTIEELTVSGSDEGNRVDIWN